MQVLHIKGTLLSAMLFVSLSARAQHHQFGFSAGAGIGGLHYKMNGQDSKLKPAVNFGLTYTFVYKSGWGLHTGIGAGFFRTNSPSAGNSSYTSNAVDSEGEAFEFRVHQNSYSETQRTYTLDIPLMLQWQTPESSAPRFYVRSGVKLMLPLKSGFSASAGEMSTTGFYPSYNVELANLPQFGFGSQSHWSGKGDTDLKPVLALAAEAGATFTICKNRLLYAGAYIDYGLNDMNKEGLSRPLLEYSINGFASSKPNGLLSLPETGRVRFISYGIRLQYAFSASSH